MAWARLGPRRLAAAAFQPAWILDKRLGPPGRPLTWEGPPLVSPGGHLLVGVRVKLRIWSMSSGTLWPSVTPKPQAWGAVQLLGVWAEPHVSVLPLSTTGGRAGVSVSVGTWVRGTGNGE